MHAMSYAMWTFLKPFWPRHLAAQKSCVSWYPRQNCSFDGCRISLETMLFFCVALRVFATKEFLYYIIKKVSFLLTWGEKYSGYVRKFTEDKQLNYGNFAKHSQILVRPTIDNFPHFTKSFIIITVPIL